MDTNEIEVKEPEANKPVLARKEDELDTKEIEVEEPEAEKPVLAREDHSSDKEDRMETTEIEVKEPEVKKSENLDWEGRKAETDRLIKNHTYGSMGVGLIPIPVVDFLALTGIQIRLLYKLSKFYGVEFSKDKAKNIISALVGSYVPVAAAGPIASMVKMVPIIGQVTGALTMLATGGACTYAVGRVFVQHFESGGTFLDFEPEKVKEYFAEQFKEGQKFATEKAASKKS